MGSLIGHSTPPKELFFSVRQDSRPMTIVFGDETSPPKLVGN